MVWWVLRACLFFTANMARNRGIDSPPGHQINSVSPSPTIWTEWGSIKFQVKSVRVAMVWADAPYAYDEAVSKTKKNVFLKYLTLLMSQHRKKGRLLIQTAAPVQKKTTNQSLEPIKWGLRQFARPTTLTIQAYCQLRVTKMRC